MKHITEWTKINNKLISGLLGRSYPVMHIGHKAGDKIFIDFAGDKPTHRPDQIAYESDDDVQFAKGRHLRDDVNVMGISL